MLGYVASSLPYLLYKQPTCVNTFAIDALEHADTITVLNILTQHLLHLVEVLAKHYKDSEFITQVINIIGLDKYNDQVEDIIYQLCISNDNLDVTVDIISTLVSYTDITKLRVKVNDKPFLGHLFKLPISAFREEEDMSDDALQWFLANYDPETLYMLLSHDMKYVNKDLLQQLLDIAVRDYKYLDNCEITGFMYECIAKQCNTSKCKALLSLVEKPLGKLIDYSITGNRSRDVVSSDITRYQDRIWNTDIGKAFFAVHVNSRMKTKVKVEAKLSKYYKYLNVLLE